MIKRCEVPALVTGPWTLRALARGKLGQPRHGLTVFSCFHCGGGSTMGYRLAGFDVLGGVEIDPNMMKVYRANHGPRHSYLMGVKEFFMLPDRELPRELFELDILDGSPPCSSFSLAGLRERNWGQKKMFREGQAKQVLDDLFFHFIDVARKLKPKIVVAENVKGLIQGNARGYVKEIFAAFRGAGYDPQLFLMDSSRMGVPQIRERTVFVARRNGLELPAFGMEFSEPRISIQDAFLGLPDDPTEMVGISVRDKWASCSLGGYPKAASGNTFGFICRNHPRRPCTTITASPRAYHWKYPRLFNVAEVSRAQSFPDDFDFGQPSVSRAHYVCGMSVPPLMIQRIATVLAQALLARP